MSTITFDTLKFAEWLEKAGLTREQAAAIAEAQKDSLAEALDFTLATKADIVRLENRIDGMICSQWNCASLSSLARSLRWPSVSSSPSCACRTDSVCRFTSVAC